jgi:type I restriction enzyme S subunit
MKHELDSVPLESIAKVIDSRHKTPSYSEAGYPMVRVVDVKGGALDLTGTKRVDEAVYADFSKGRDPEIGDLVISRVGSYGVVSYVNSNDKFCLGQNTALIVPKINSRFLYYQLVSPLVKQQIDFMVVGAVQKTISLKSIKQLQITLPSKSEQEAIAHILGTLDDKIELNRQMNETLEAMAQALFKSWFVDFDPVIDNALAAGNEIPEPLQARAEKRQALGDQRKPLAPEIQSLFPDRFVFTDEMGWVPEGWNVTEVGNEFEITGGGTPSTKEPAYWENGTNAFCTPKDMSGLGTIRLGSTERHLTDLGVSKVSSGLLPGGTVVMSSRAPIGYLAITDIPVAVNQGIIAMLPNETYSPMFMLLWARANMASIEDRANGSTFQEISKKNFRPIPFLKPNSNLVTAFTEQAQALYQRLSSSDSQVSSLIKVRDALLPKLLSGELRISDAENQVAEAL